MCLRKPCGMASVSGQPPSVSLEAMLSARSDVCLVFVKKETLPAHSVILRQWSGVLDGLLDGCSDSGKSLGAGLGSSSAPENSACADPGCQVIRIPMKGTTKQDWLIAMSFVYPVLPRPCVSWDNLEVLLTMANKYDMPALLSRAGEFLQDNMQQLTGSPASLQYAWKWINLADKAGLQATAQACNTICFRGSEAGQLMGACKKTVVAGLSPATCCHLLETMAQQSSAAMKPGMAYCNKCKHHRPMWFTGGPEQRYGFAPVSGMLRCQVCGHETLFATAG